MPAPYGNKSPEVICEHTRQAVEFLFAHGAGLIILTRNTASAKALAVLSAIRGNSFGIPFRQDASSLLLRFLMRMLGRGSIIAEGQGADLLRLQRAA
jgi:hypothetical protein